MRARSRGFAATELRTCGDGLVKGPAPSCQPVALV